MKANKCCKCGTGLRHGEAIYADNNGVLSLRGKPYCSDCLAETQSKDNDDYQYEIETDDVD